MIKINGWTKNKKMTQLIISIFIPIRNPYTEMIRFVYVLCTFLKIPYQNSVYFICFAFLHFFKKIDIYGNDTFLIRF